MSADEGGDQKATDARSERAAQKQLRRAEKLARGARREDLPEGEAEAVSEKTLAALVRAASARDPRRMRAALGHEGFALYERKPKYDYMPTQYRKLHAKVRSPLEDADFIALAEPLVEHGRTTLTYERLHTLYQALENVLDATPRDERVQVLEVGVFQGGSCHFLASAAQALAPGRASVIAVDTFDGHSPLDLPDGQEGAHSVATFAETSFELVRDFLAEFSFVEVVQGRVQDVAESLAETRFHLVHLDVDIFAPTAFTLEFVGERLVDGGVVVVDDYNFKTCPGVKQAVDEFLAASPRRFFKLALESGQCCLVAT